MLLLPERLTLADAPAALRMLSQALQGEDGATVVVDASALKRFDSSALAVLIECGRLAQAAGKGFALRQVPPKLAELARLYGVAGALGLEAAAAAAAAIPG